MSAVLSACLLAAFSACGGGSSKSSDSSTAAVTISISPQSITIPVSTSQQFSAAVLNTSNTDVTWQVNSTTGGSATYGTITTSGLYTAPPTVPSSAITVTAIAKADTTKTATASVTLTNANTLVVSPAQVTVPAGGQQSFSATLGGAGLDATWSVSCNTSGPACGTISANGIYTAPLAPPPGRSVIVRASSSGANPASASLTINFGSGTLIGSYTYALTGTEGGQPYSSVGSISFDGKGGITGGTADRPGRVVTITGGTYIADSQGRVAATVNTDAGEESWQITLVNHSRAFVMRTDSVVARGEMDLQDSLQFTNPFNGPFNFHVAGKSSGPIRVAGMLGALAFDSQAGTTSGVIDSNDGGTVLANESAIGTFTRPDANTGRGTLSLSSSFGPQTFAYYVINSTSARLIEITGTHDFVGKLVSRVASTTVDASYFQGNYAFVFSGANNSEAVGQGGTFTLDRNGNITNGVLDRSTDSAYALGFLLSGSLTVADPATGRSIVTFNSGGTTLQYVVYPPSPNYENSSKYGLAFLEIDNGNVTSGLALQQQGTVYAGSATSLTGQFALLAGESSGAVRRTVGGRVAISSTATGTLDVNDNANVSLAGTLQGSNFAMTSLAGRGQFLLQTDNYSASYTAYIVDRGTVLLMETDRKGVLTGQTQSQY